MGCSFIIRAGRHDNMQKLKKYERILADHPEKDDYLKYIFDIIKNDSGRDRRLFNYIKYNLNKLPSQNLDQFKIGAVHFIIHKNIFKSSLENYVLRFGEKYGNILFNNFVDKCVSTLENFKKRYGNGWEVRWDNFKDKSANFKLEHYIKKYGSDLGKIKYNERLKKTKEQNVFCYDYWLKLGYTKCEAREILSKQADTSSLNSVMLRLGPASKTKNQDEVTHVDHMVSKFFGFHNNILPQIIGSVYNLDVIDASKNISKNTKNSIDIDELFNNYFKGANDGC